MLPSYPVVNNKAIANICIKCRDSVPSRTGSIWRQLTDSELTIKLKQLVSCEWVTSRQISFPWRLHTLVSTDVIPYSSTPLDVGPKHLCGQPSVGPQIESGPPTLRTLDGRHNSLFACPRDFIRISEMTTFVFQIKYTTCKNAGKLYEWIKLLFPMVRLITLGFRDVLSNRNEGRVSKMFRVTCNYFTQIQDNVSDRFSSGDWFVM